MIIAHILKILESSTQLKINLKQDIITLWEINLEPQLHPVQNLSMKHRTMRMDLIMTDFMILPTLENSNFQDLLQPQKHQAHFMTDLMES